MPENFPGDGPQVNEGLPEARPEPQAVPLSLPRIPAAVDGIQANSCRTVGCENFGVEPAEAVTRGGVRAGTTRVTDGYRVVGHNKVKGWKRLRCLRCGGHTTFKSNLAIREELERLAAYLEPTPEPACATEACPSNGIGVHARPSLYYPHGKTKAGSPRWRCKACRAVVTERKPGREQRRSAENLTVFRLLVNKSPIKAIARVADLSPSTVYDKIDFIHRQCLAFVAHRERQLRNRELPPLWISCDRQDYVLNWSDRHDKRITQLTAIGSAENRTGYVFGMHVNYDPAVALEAVVQAAEAAGDPLIEEPAFRRHARLWLPRDYQEAVRRDPGLNFPPPARPGVDGLIEAAEQVMEAVADSEALERVFPTSRPPSKGMQVHFEYTAHAHFRLLARLLANAPGLHFYIDQDDTLRAAILSAFRWPITDGRVDAFFVQIDKTLTVDERKHLVGRSAREFERVRQVIRRPDMSDREVLMFLLSLELRRMHEDDPGGHWRNRWLKHPQSTMHEPDKAICYITDRGGHDVNDPDALMALTEFYARASLHGIDRYFMQLRRLLSLLERPIATPSNVGRVWRGYSPYNPAIVQKLLDIYRVYYNYVKAERRTRGAGAPRTPAMKLGLAKGQVAMEDILYFGR